ncbi:hypothetical protein ABZ864_41115 [Streptomyces sp. NPDC047082]|uniref:hypothetical protein n=1 Tax=Streptomyces sp. NPDC047082 TaxID=3155259 RepID=UPI0034118A22
MSSKEHASAWSPTQASSNTGTSLRLDKERQQTEQELRAGLPHVLLRNGTYTEMYTTTTRASDLTKEGRRPASPPSCSRLAASFITGQTITVDGGHTTSRLMNRM